eukprot:6892-Heterococcus_DN1.PRE.10
MEVLSSTTYMRTTDESLLLSSLSYCTSNSPSSELSPPDDEPSLLTARRCVRASNSSSGTGFCGNCSCDAPPGETLPLRLPPRGLSEPGGDLLFSNIAGFFNIELGCMQECMHAVVVLGEMTVVL